MIFFPLVVGLLGISPHVRFSIEQGALNLFKSGSDEDTYAEWTLERSPRSDRVISHAAYKLLYETAGRNHDLAFMAMDFLFPAVFGFLSLLLVGSFTSSRLLQVLLASLLLFGQELLSTGCQVVWPRALALWNLLPKMLAESRILQELIPFYSTSFFAVFRSPEPQVSWCIFIAFFLAWLGPVKAGKIMAEHLKFLLPAYLFLPFTYVFVVIPLYFLSAAVMIFLIAHKQLKEGLWVIGLTGLSLGLKVFYDLGADNGHFGFIFESRMPVVTTSLLISAALLYFFLRKKFPQTFGEYFFCATLSFPVVICFQQVVTGAMISVRDFEINSNYLMLIVGAIGWTWARAGFQPLPVVSRSKILLPTLVITGILLTSMWRTYTAWHFHNNLSLKYLALIGKHLDTQDQVLIKDHPEVIPLVNLRNKNPIKFLVDFNDAQETLVADMKSADLPPVGREVHKKNLFEYFYRLNYSPEQVAELLRAEIKREKGYFFLPFLFSIKDTWWPLTENRQVKVDWVLKQISHLQNEYLEYRTNSQKSFLPTLIVSAEPLQTNEIWANSLQEKLKLKSDKFLFIYRQEKIDSSFRHFGASDQ